MPELTSVMPVSASSPRVGVEMYVHDGSPTSRSSTVNRTVVGCGLPRESNEIRPAGKRRSNESSSGPACEVKIASSPSSSSEGWKLASASTSSRKIVSSPSSSHPL